MYKVDTNRCNGCGVCADVCPPGAITLKDDTAVIDQKLCTQCGDCAVICPTDAVYVLEPAYAQSASSARSIKKGGDTMPYGYGYGAGFGFRGSSPPWPYVGRGRGGLPRCLYPGLGGAPLAAAPYATPGTAAYGPAPTPEEELGFLKDQSNIVKRQLEDIERRIQELEAEK